MVLVVVAHVEGEEVEGAIVAVGLLAFHEHVVLGDEVTRHGVNPHSQKASRQHVQ